MFTSIASAFSSEWRSHDCHLHRVESLHPTPLGLLNPCLVVTDCPIYLFSPGPTSEVREGIILFLLLSPQFNEFEIMIIIRINRLGNRPRSPTRVITTSPTSTFSSELTSHDYHLHREQSPHPTPLSIFNPCLVNSSWRNKKQLWLPPVDMLQVLDLRMVTQPARKRVSFTAFTFTTPSFWYSFQFAPSELNRSLYDITHWSLDGLPCVAILFTTLSFPRSICKYCPIALGCDDQEPLLPLLWTLLRRACHGSYSDVQNEDAFTASFGISLFSIPRGWMRHSVGRKTNSFLFKFKRL